MTKSSHDTLWHGACHYNVNTPRRRAGLSRSARSVLLHCYLKMKSITRSNRSDCSARKRSAALRAAGLITQQLHDMDMDDDELQSSLPQPPPNRDQRGQSTGTSKMAALADPRQSFVHCFCYCSCQLAAVGDSLLCSNCGENPCSSLELPRDETDIAFHHI